MSRASKLIERCLWAVGFLALGACALVWLNARLEQDRGNQELDRRIVSPPTSIPEKNKTPAHDSVIGRIEIPRLALSAVVFEGTDSPVLEHGIGHLSGSHLPGESGNVVFAGHRDTFFRGLKDIRPRDLITVTTEEGTRRYLVQSTTIVDPDQTSVLKDTSSRTLTLITCYPFYYIGQAPQRFVVRSREVVERAAAPSFEAIAFPAPPKPMVVRRRKPVLQAKAASFAPESAMVAATSGPSNSEESEAQPPHIGPPTQPEPESVAPADPPDPVHTTTAPARQSFRSRINPVRLAGKIVHAIRNSTQ